MNLNKQPSDIAEALSLASAWNAKHVARIAELEAELAEARKDSERLDKLESYPYAMEIKAIAQYHKSDSVPSIRAQIDHFIATEIDGERGAK